MFLFCEFICLCECTSKVFVCGVFVYVVFFLQKYVTVIDAVCSPSFSFSFWFTLPSVFRFVLALHLWICIHLKFYRQGRSDPTGRCNRPLPAKR